ncbi:MAG: trimethylamine methyltransferase family protein [Candidatus Zixiibacteriota bacterium]
MRPVLKFLPDDLIDRIISEAFDILCRLGVEIHNPPILQMLADFSAKVDFEKRHVIFTRNMIDTALKTIPKSFSLYDIVGSKTHDFSGLNVYFTPGSSALNILDYDTGQTRRPNTGDYIKYAKLVSRLENLRSQSTAFVPADVPEKVSDSYRLYLSLLYCEKPVITGAFTAEAFEIMKDMQLAVRGSEEALREKPLTVFSCCPTSPLKWSDVTSQNLVDCARHGIPVEYIAMPLAGFIAPVTLVGSLIQHTAETLSGVIITQLTSPGAPALYGGSPAIFDIRYETPPMGAVETMMIDCAYCEIGRKLGFPTQAYISLSDAKLLDTQAGLESSMGATLAALAGINSVSGPGMLDFENCISFEKLVVDNEICGMTARLVAGIEPKEDFPSFDHFEELLRDKHLLIADHTRKYLREEHYFPGPVIDRASRSRWLEEGGQNLNVRAHNEVERLVKGYELTRLPFEIQSVLTRLMTAETKRHGLDRLPERL